MLEKLLAEYLNLTYRKIENKERSLDFVREDDKAFVRCKFKHHLKSMKPKTIILMNSKDIIKIDNGLDFNSINSINKTMELISSWCIKQINNDVDITKLILR